MNNSEGYIKFSCNWKNYPVKISKETLSQLNHWREKLYKAGLIGILPEGIGFGNLSIRDLPYSYRDQFIISGSATGRFEKLTLEHYSRVIEYSIANNELTCEGLTKASSESLSHAIIYETLSDVGAIIHTHNKDIWRKNINALPTTHQDAEYGTPEMAFSIRELLKQNKPGQDKIIIMGGHEDGVITYGHDLEQAYNTLIKYYND